MKDRIQEIKERRGVAPKIGYLVTALSVLPGGEEAAYLATSDVNFLLTEIERLRQGLWDCARYAGIDTDGDETPCSFSGDLVKYAVDAVKEHREQYDELLDELPLTPSA